MYHDSVLAIEPYGTGYIDAAERHGKPRDLFGLWFGANAEAATWAVGILATALFGTSLHGAVLGLVLGNLGGYAIMGLVSTFGPRYGVPQMVQSRYAFGFFGNAAPASLSFLSGIGWFAVDSVLGAYALDALTHIGYLPSLGILCVAQIAIVVYGYNLIHVCERYIALALTLGFVVLGVATFARADFSAGFNAHAPLSSGGEVAGIILSAALAFSYVCGWMPFAADYSRYLPQSCGGRAVWWWSFLGGFIPCTLLEVMGAATVTAVHGLDLTSVPPTAAITALLGTGIAGSIGLLTILLGTLTANVLNLYSAAMSALAVWGVRVARWQAALAVGIVGGVLSSVGSNPLQTQQLYTDFLLILATWVSPWAAVVIVDRVVHRHDRPDAVTPASRSRAFRPGAVAWAAGVAAALPFVNQSWFVGPVARTYPAIGDVSYYVGFSVAVAMMLIFAAGSPSRHASARRSPDASKG
jgi:nucleobase:cation symporter-1, NCS1 family